MSNDTKHRSDCAVHNAPAYEPGECDCGVLQGPEDCDSPMDSSEAEECGE